ncbi:two-component sensor histidine kinase [Flavobacterium magnum]|uniref:histidine kinase n=1 Tax=Flavobacterium magnum TaxID=2162713 RepID=A0A2S0RD62_9FLAO|nr:HAMP domain-containing sensor histidine kinase [Flavobacterium magnum]AWA29041.1 two-component sensor histidine kinase [Flavobacterium magnum]
MEFSERRNATRWAIIAASFVIVLLILWNTYALFQIFKNEERIKLENWALAQEKINSIDVNDVNADLELPFALAQHPPSIPIILAMNNTIVNTNGIDEAILKDKRKLNDYINKLKSLNDPIVTRLSKDKTQYLYYGDSSLLNKLKYYPVALLLIIFLFATVVYNFYRSTKMATQNKLWAGMAKETAHQIGTPLSSLLGWLEIMKADQVDETTVKEIEKDVVRLQSIADRFSKIGSEPILEEKDIIAETEASVEYLKSRFSNQVAFTFTGPHYPVMVMVNPILHSWTVENLVKNAIDAMRGKGNLDIAIIDGDRFLRIYISDTGKGIPKKQFRRVFEPGFTTKKRGWGLGLSLTKRIVEEYHDGKIRVLHSELGKGTTIMVSFRKLVR